MARVNEESRPEVDLSASADFAALPERAVFTATRVGSLPGSYLAGWDDKPSPLSIWHVPIRPEARLYEIHGPAEWAALVRRYPAETTASSVSPAPDWWTLADDWDGVHLSMAGYLTVPECGHWLHESTAWLRSLFGEISRLPDWPYAELFTNFAWPPPSWPPGVDVGSTRQGET